jgi:hypothetical protein
MCIWRFYLFGLLKSLQLSKHSTFPWQHLQKLKVCLLPPARMTCNGLEKMGEWPLYSCQTVEKGGTSTGETSELLKSFCFLYIYMYWLVVSTLWNIWVRQLGILFPIYGKSKIHVPNHQPANYYHQPSWLTINHWCGSYRWFSIVLPAINHQYIYIYHTLYPSSCGWYHLSLAESGSQSSPVCC